MGACVLNNPNTKQESGSGEDDTRKTREDSQLAE